jgi:hypothetical protein
MTEKIIKYCCKHCVEQNVNCLGCAVASNAVEVSKDFCKECEEKGECVIKFDQMKNRETCWILSEEDEVLFANQNPAFAEEKKKKALEVEKKQAESLSETDIEKLERMLKLAKEKKNEKI